MDLLICFLALICFFETLRIVTLLCGFVSFEYSLEALCEKGLELISLH